MRTWSLTVLTASFFLFACAPPPAGPGFPEITHEHLPQIGLKVSRVEIVDRYQPPAQPPNVEHLFPVSLSSTALDWGRQRLRATGGTGYARVVLHRASVVEVGLSGSEGIKGLFTIDQSDRYDGVLEMSVEIVDGQGELIVSVKSTAKRSQSISEIASEYDQQKTWFLMTDALISDMNLSLEEQIRTHLSDWIAA